MRRALMVAVVAAALTSSGCSNLGGGSVQLFNGKDLTGWAPEGGAKWEVTDGMLIGSQGANYAPGDLFTTANYQDFELKGTWKAVWPCNSGIWFRYVNAGKSYQYDILEWPSPVAYSGTIYAPGLGSRVFLTVNERKELVKRDDWNEMRLLVKGDHIQAWLNGVQTADVHDTRIPDPGRIGIQIHPGDQFGPMKIMIKELKLRELK